MKIIAISDTHNTHKSLKIPECDILIHSGDATSMGYEHEIRDFMRWFKKQPSKYHIFVPGNHEVEFEKHLPASMEWIKEEFPECIVLIDETVVIEGIKIHGSPVSPWFHDWAWNRYRGEQIQRHWNNIPEDTEILITHGPPYGTLDEIFRIDGSSYSEGPRLVGCEMLERRLRDLKVGLHIFGHIHCSAGFTYKGNTTYVNASMLDDRYYKNDIQPIEITREMLADGSIMYQVTDNL